MAEQYRPRMGDVITTSNGTKGVVIRVGRGLVRSMIVVWESTNNRPTLLNEIDYWIRLGRFEFVSRKPGNIKWAQEYNRINKDTLAEV